MDIALPTFKQLEAFVAVVDQGTFESAAKRLGVAQSAVSRLIQELEGWFGFKLFDRVGRVARPSIQSGEVLSIARQILLDKHNLESSLYSNQVLSRNLKVGVTELSALTWLPAFVRAVGEEFPKVRIEPEVDQSTHLMQQLAAGQLDIIVVPNAFATAGLVTLELDEVVLGWFCAPALMDTSRTFSLTELTTYPLLAQSNSSGSGALIRQWMTSLNVMTTGYIPCNSLVASIGLTISALGVTYLPISVAAPFVENGQLVEISVEPKLPLIKYVALAKADMHSVFHKQIFELIKTKYNLMKMYTPAAVSICTLGQR